MVDCSVPVSVVIPCFRCAHTIERALTSVLQQTALPIEVILVDDASNDGTREALNILQQHHPTLIKITSLERNVGAGAARNVGWAMASQPYVAFLDADDSWHPEKLMRQYAFMAAHPHIALSGHLCNVKIEDEAGAVSRLQQTITTRTVTPFQWLLKNAFSTPTVMLRRDIPLRFADGRRYSEDYLLWQQIAFSGYEVVRLEAPLAQVHKPFYGAAGLSANLWKMEQGELANFAILRRGGSINFPMYLFACAFSLLKFARRWVLVHIRGRRVRQR